MQRPSIHPTLAAARLGRYLSLAVPLTLLFIAVYGGTNRFNSGRSDYFELYFGWETKLPLVPWMVLVYLSLQLLFLSPLLHWDWPAVRRLAGRMALAIVLAGLVFLLVPTRPGFEPVARSSGFAPLFDLVHRFDRPHNLFPSLHVTLSTLLVLYLLPLVRGGLVLVYLCWLVLLYLSVVLVHQHHVADIVAGVMLAGLVVVVIPGSGRRGAV